MSAQAELVATWAVDLRGAGQVGGALLRLLEGRGIRVAAVHRRRGVEHRGVGASRRVMVDATPPAFEGAAAPAWIEVLADTLQAGTPVVTCNKAPLALAWRRLGAAARSGGVPLAATATVGGGSPILSCLRAAHAQDPIRSVRATLSGTLGIVLPRVHAGASLREAVADAQAAGYCEPDARLDLDGTDAWAKACIVHNALWPEVDPVQLRDRPGVLALDERAIRALRNPALVADLAPRRVTLGLADWAPGSQGGIFVRAWTATGASVDLSGAGAGPGSTAAALLSDVESIAAGRFGPGIVP